MKRRKKSFILDSFFDEESDEEETTALVLTPNYNRNALPVPGGAQSYIESPSKQRELPFVPVVKPSPKKITNTKKSTKSPQLFQNATGIFSGINIYFLSNVSHGITTQRRELLSNLCQKNGARVIQYISPDDKGAAVFHIVSSSESVKSITYKVLATKMGFRDEAKLKLWIDLGLVVMITDMWITRSLEKKVLQPISGDIGWKPILSDNIMVAASFPSSLGVQEEIAVEVKKDVNSNSSILEKTNAEHSKKRPISNKPINYGRNWNTTISMKQRAASAGGGGGGGGGGGYDSSDKEEEDIYGGESLQQCSQLSQTSVQEIGSQRNYLKRIKVNLACQQGADGSLDTTLVNHNGVITKALDDLALMHASTRFKEDQWRVMNLKKASKMLKRLPYKVESIEQLAGIKGFGSKTLQKIEEILNTGNLERLENFKLDPKLVAMTNLTTVWGVGKSTARSLIEVYGIYTVKQLQDRIKQDLEAGDDGRVCVVNDIVARTAMIHDDLVAKIPRKEVEAIRDLVIPVADAILPGIELQVVGSYRRGNAASGDVDMLITHPSWFGKDGSPESGTRETYHKRKKFLTTLTNLLIEKKIMAFNITEPSQCDGGDHFSTSYMGVACPLDPMKQILNEEEIERGMGIIGGGYEGGKHRRVDIKCYPKEEMPFALLYFTGNAYFNRSMRWFAKRKGLTLSDHGMSECVRKWGDKIMTHDSVKAECEKDIFDYLGLQYLSPEQRECNEKVVEALGKEMPPPDAYEGLEESLLETSRDEQEAHSSNSSSMNLKPKYSPSSSSSFAWFC